MTGPHDNALAGTRSDGDGSAPGDFSRSGIWRFADQRTFSATHAAAWFLGMAVAYWGASKFGLLFTNDGAEVSVCWPGAGLALGAMAVAPRKAIPWIALGVLVSNWIANAAVGRDLGISGAYATVNAFMPWLGTLLLGQVSGRPFDLREPADLARLCVFGIAIPCAIGAVGGAAAASVIGDFDFFAVWRTWWASDSLGVLLVAPVVIGWADRGRVSKGGPWRVAEAVAMLVTVLLVSAAVFSGVPATKSAFLQLPAPVFPVLLWAALRFGVCGAGVAVIAAAAVAVMGTHAGHGPFFRVSPFPAEQLTLAQATFAIFSVASQVVATAMRARNDREALLRSERRNADSAFDRSPIGLALASPEGLFVRVNVSLCRMLGRSQEGLLDRPASGVLQQCDAERFDADLLALREGGDAVPQRPVRCPRTDGDDVFAHVHMTPIRDDRGELIHCFVQFIDLSRERRAEQAVRESEARLKLALGNAGHGLWDWDIPSGNCVIDEGWQSIHGYAYGEVRGRIEMWNESIHPDDRQRVQAALRAHLSHETAVYDLDYRARRKDGSWVWINTRGRVTHRDESGRPIRMMGTIHDITERKFAEERLRQSIRDKEVLLREIHHRVKNNLAAVSGLLLLRSNQTDNPEFRAAFAESRDRVRSIALVHDTLHRSDNLDAVDMSAYLRSLASQISSTFAGGPVRVEIEVRADPIRLDTQTAVPCGLIVNELLTNCYKHAFPGRSEGRVWIDAVLKDQRCTIVVRDDGVGGSPPEDETKTLGIRLMKRLASQIGGDVEFRDAGPGLEGRLSFVIPNG